MNNKMIKSVISFLLLFVLNTAHGGKDRAAEETTKYWNDLALKELHETLRGEILNRNIAKNVILFIGSGMGISTQTAGRIYKAQKNDKGGAETPLAMDQLPHVAISRTYSVDRQVPDEAGTATAILCGVKTKSGLVAMSPSAHHDWCAGGEGKEVQSVLIDAYNAGKSTGIVTTKRIVDSTVAAAYAHSVSDYWYSDASMPNLAKVSGCKDLALQFYEASGNITVAFGGGRKYLLPNSTFDDEYSVLKNVRLDGKNLIEMWKNREKKKGFNPKYVWNKTSFDNVDVKTTDRLIGLFEPEAMKYEAHRSQSTDEPSLAEMTSKALAMLQKNENGYFLLVEGGRIGDAHRDNIAYNALNELVAFDDAIDAAVTATESSDTLIIVTSDHGNVMTIGGSTERESYILGLATTQTGPLKAFDNRAMTILGYGNGPGFLGYHRGGETGRQLPIVSIPTFRIDPNTTDTKLPTYLQQSAVPLKYGTSGGEDVPIMARGPMAHLFHGVHEQHYIAHVIRYASCIGDNSKHCEEGHKAPGIVDYLGNVLYATEAGRTLRIQFICLIVLAVLLFFSLVAIVVLYRKSNAIKYNQNHHVLPKETILSETTR